MTTIVAAAMCATIPTIRPNLPYLHKTLCAQPSALPSHAAAVTLSFDLTADTPPSVNDRRGGNARHDFDHPPNLPHLHETSKYARSNTSHVLEPVTAPVTNSSSSPWRKKSRSLLRRYSGKENLSNDVSFLSSTPVENRKSPWENLTPVVDVLAGKNSSVTSSVSRLDSDTLSASCLDTVRFPILVGTNQFRGAREIPRILDGSSWANFYPRCKSPPWRNHLEGSCYFARTTSIPN